MATKNEGRATKCAICMHRERARIETLRLGGASYRVLSAKFAISKDSLHRHMLSHVAPERKATLIVGPVKIDQVAEKAAEEGR